MLRRTSLCLCALLAALPASGCHGDPKAQAAAPPPPGVLFAKAVRKDVPLYVEAVASVDGYVNADIRARVRGYLSSQDYKDGAVVRVNAPLFTIEATEYRTAIASARAALARARAAQQRNRLQLDRNQGLFKSGAVSQQEIDNADAANADSDGQVASAQAQLEQAQLNLSYTQIRSPVEGVAGVAAVRVGNLVGQDGPTLLTTVSQIDPMRVTFPLSENDYVKFPERFKGLSERNLEWARAQFARLKAGAAADHDDPGIQLVLSDGSPYAHRGVVVSVGRQIDSSTGTIQVQALIPNPDGFLRPGQYGKVRFLRENEGKNAITVPDKALLLVQGAYSVGVLGDDDKVSMRSVEVGPSVDGMRLITKGVSEGDRVVVEGVQKISDGAKVAAKPAPPPAAQAPETGRKTSTN